MFTGGAPQVEKPKPRFSLFDLTKDLTNPYKAKRLIDESHYDEDLSLESVNKSLSL
jgi:hypothetical protein